MVAVTDRAKVALLDLKLAHEIPGPGTSLRLAGAPGGEIGLLPDEEKPGDQVVEYEGSKVLLIGPELASPLAGRAVDCITTPQGPQLVITASHTGDSGQPYAGA